MATDAEIEAAFQAMRAIPTRGGEVHDDVLRVYARAALQAAQVAQVREFHDLRRAESLADEAHQVAVGTVDSKVTGRKPLILLVVGGTLAKV
jgi:hypothetical protein